MVFGFLANLNPLKWFKSSKNQSTSPSGRSKSSRKSKSPKSKSVSRECTPAELVFSQLPFTQSSHLHEQCTLPDQMDVVSTVRGPENTGSSFQQLLNQREDSEVEGVDVPSNDNTDRILAFPPTSNCGLEDNIDGKDVEMVIIDVNRSQSIDESPHPAALNWQSSRNGVGYHTPQRTPPSTRVSKKRRRASSDARDSIPVSPLPGRVHRKIPKMGIAPIQGRKSFKRSSPPPGRIRTQKSRIITNVSASNLRKAAQAVISNSSTVSCLFSPTSSVKPEKRPLTTSSPTPSVDIEMTSPSVSTVESNFGFSNNKIKDELMDTNVDFSDAGFGINAVDVTSTPSHHQSPPVLRTLEKFDNTENLSVIEIDKPEKLENDIEVVFADIKPRRGRKTKTKQTELHQSVLDSSDVRRSSRQRRAIVPYADTSMVNGSSHAVRCGRERCKTNFDKKLDQKNEIDHVNIEDKLGYTPILAKLTPMKPKTSPFITSSENSGSNIVTTVSTCVFTTYLNTSNIFDNDAKFGCSGDEIRRLYESPGFVPTLESLREDRESVESAESQSSVSDVRRATFRNGRGRESMTASFNKKYKRDERDAVVTFAATKAPNSETVNK